MNVECPMCSGKGVMKDAFMCAYCGGDGSVSTECRRQYLEYLVKEPLHPETIEGIFRPIKDDGEGN